METPPIELIVFVGIPASGKSTFFRQRLAGRYVHVSLDNWRGKDNVRHKERCAIEAGLREAAEGQTGVCGVVVDNTNTTARTRQRYFEYARAAEASAGRPVTVIAYFFDADLAGCLRRNQQRPEEAPAGTPYFVPPAAIANFHRILEPPTREEGFARIVRVRIADEEGFVVEDA
ncbi:MAG TPA: ATP-binding protein [Phycisphaerae bacterium]|nr:ATP-binding protein [Phycisphaerae bacterium]